MPELRSGLRGRPESATRNLIWVSLCVATRAVLDIPYYLGLKAEALHLANRTSEALGAIEEAEKAPETFEERHCRADLHRLRGVFLAALSADEGQIEAAFGEAIRIAKQQKSVSLEKRAEANIFLICCDGYYLS